jgi:predicted nucleic acid-binding protein
MNGETFPRDILDDLIKWLDRREAYAIKGPRQSGKTTILKVLQEKLKGKNVVFLNLRAHCSLYHQLKEEGILVPDADLLIAATAMSHHIALKTKDEHFERLRHLGLRLEQEPKEQRE